MGLGDGINVLRAIVAQVAVTSVLPDAPCDRAAQPCDHAMYGRDTC